MLQSGSSVNNTKKRFEHSDSDQDDDRPREEDRRPLSQKKAEFSKNRKDLKLATVSFLDKEEEEGQIRSNNLEFKKSAKVYHSSSEEEEDEIEVKKSKRSKYDVLAKLESFNR